MKYWAVFENDEIVMGKYETPLLFKTKASLLAYFEDSLGELNSIRRVHVIKVKK